MQFPIYYSDDMEKEYNHLKSSAYFVEQWNSHLMAIQDSTGKKSEVRTDQGPMAQEEMKEQDASTISFSGTLRGKSSVIESLI